MHTPARLLLWSVPMLCSVSLSAQAGWQPPALETSVNSTAADSGPHLAFDGLRLHLSSFRSGNWEIYTCTRAGIGLPWSTPTLVSELSDPSTDDQPFLTLAGDELWFSSLRAGGQGGFDILRSTWSATTQSWSPPAHVTELNGTGSESAVSLTADGLEAFFLSTSFGNPGGNNNSIFRATRTSTSAPFGVPTLVSELFNGNTHRDCEIAWDGLSITYTEFTGGRLQVFQADRPVRGAAFLPPRILTEFSTVGTVSGVFSFTRAHQGNEAFLAAGFASASGSQEILRTTFRGLSQFGAAGPSATMSLYLRDPQLAGSWYSIGAALGNTGFPLGANVVPLDPDWLLFATLGVNVAGYTMGWGGQLDANGEAVASLTSAAPWLLGFSFHVGALVWSNQSPFGVGLIANSIPVAFQ